MQTARRRRNSWAVAASVLVHLGVLAAALVYRPTLNIPNEPGGPPEPIIPILLMPRTPTPLAGRHGAPAPIQLHRRTLRNMPTETPVAPVVIPTARPAEAPAQAPAPVAVKPQPPPGAPPEAVRATLRATLGCTEARLPGMSRDDRAGCLERLGRGAHEAAYLPPALSPEKRAALEEAGAAKLAQKNAADRAPPPPGSRTPAPQDYSGEPDVATNAMPAHAYSPSKRAARVLKPLPP
jgi:translation initiation factor IF-2